MTTSAHANDPLVAASAATLRTALRDYARRELPDAMVPTRFVALPQLPTLPNGKIDRKRLPDRADFDGSETEYLAPRNEIELQLARIWEDLLGRTHIGVDSNFLEIGGNSLSALQMVGQVRALFDVRIDLRRLFENPTIAHLAQMIGAKGVVHVAVTGNPRGVNAEEMRSDAALPEDIGSQPGAAAPHTGAYTELLLTGGTGYTGAFLLRELLDRSTAVVNVLVRAENSERARCRVLANLAEFGLQRPGDAERILGVPGNTARPYLGMSRTDYRRIAAHVQLIVHNAAISSWLAPYRKLKATNVFGALEVLRLAGAERIKAVHFVSTLGIYPSRSGVVSWPEARLADADRVTGGYRQTKWVADNLMLAARERGIPTHVYRLGLITGSEATGACSPDTFINHLLKGCIQLGVYFDYDVPVELVPVDYCAAAIVHVALEHATSAPAVCNIPSSRTATMTEIFGLVAANGYPLRRLTYAEWYNELIRAVERGDDNQLAIYLPLFGQDGPAEELGCPGGRPAFEAKKLRAVLAGSGIRCPDIDAALFGRYLDYFTGTGYLPSASPNQSAPLGGPR